MSGQPHGRTRVFLAAAIGVVVLAVGAGFFILGSPADVRAKRLDEQRVGDLRHCEATVVSYWLGYERLPPSVDKCEYRPLQGSTYELCAVFDRESGGGFDGRFPHGTGRTCFVLDARTSAGAPRPVRR